MLPPGLFPGTASSAFVLFHFQRELSSNSGFFPTKGTGLLTSINGKLQYFCWTNKLSITLSAATRVIREHMYVFFVFFPPESVPKKHFM